MRSLELAIKYLAGDRLIGTAAERAAMTQNLPDYEQDFTTDATQNGWTATGSTWGSYSSSNPYVVLNPSGQGSGTADPAVAFTYDLQHADALNGSNLSDTEWVFQFTAKVHSYSANSTCNYVDAVVAISDGTQWGSNNNSHFGIGFGNTDCSPNSEVHEIKFLNKHNKNLDGFHSVSDTNYQRVPDTQGEGYDLESNVGTTVGIRFVRTGSTAAYGQVWNSTFTTQIGSNYSLTESHMSNLDDLRYIHLTAYSQGGASGIEIRISDIKIWNDATSITPVYPNLTNGAIFEESDTGKHYMFDGTSAWNEM